MESGAPTTHGYLMKAVLIAIRLGSVHDIRVYNCVLNTDVWEPPVFGDHVCWKRLKVLGHARLVELRVFIRGDPEYFGESNWWETITINERVHLSGPLLWGDNIYQCMHAFKFDSQNQNVQPKMSQLTFFPSKTATFLSRFVRAYILHFFSYYFCAVSEQVHIAFTVAVAARGQHTERSRFGKGRGGREVPSGAEDAAAVANDTVVRTRAPVLTYIEGYFGALAFRRRIVARLCLRSYSAS